MPSDCQCSNACACETKIIKEVLNDREATRKLRQLEREVKTLREENRNIKARLKKKAISKKSLVKKLKDQLDRM